MEGQPLALPAGVVWFLNPMALDYMSMVSGSWLKLYRPQAEPSVFVLQSPADVNGIVQVPQQGSPFTICRDSLESRVV